MDLNINVEEHFNQATNPISSNNNNNNTSSVSNKSKADLFMDNYDIASYGLPLEDVYNLARNFIKGDLFYLKYFRRKFY
jgi:hypothetical protein